MIGKITLWLFIVISYVGVILSPIWAAVEFILYLCKDRPFNWWSVWSFFICIICTLLGILFETISGEVPIKNKNISNLTTGKKSKFQLRLEEMEKERLTKINKN